MAPATKKRKTESDERYRCTSCDTNRTSRQFPDYNPTPDCDHLIHTCKSCLSNWVTSNVESGNFANGGEDGKVFGVKCPECDSIMRNVNVEIAATKKIHKRFEELERKHIGNTTPGWRWCMDATCPAGQVHEPKKIVEEPPAKRTRRKGSVKKPTTKDEAAPEPDICTCNKCGFQACATCDRPWHEGESCSQYRARIKDHHVEEEDKALQQIRKIAKACPNCGKKIERNGGCPMMFCTQCQTNFCWNCVSVVKAGRCDCSSRR